MEQIEFTPETLMAFKIMYERHKHNSDTPFVFQGKEFMPGYAKYLIEFLEPKLLNPAPSGKDGANR